MENRRLKRVAALHDLSCFGRCALTVILPVISASGVQAVPVPTALLSTHTGGFENMSFLDLNGEMKKISAHFDELYVDFDAVYTGFLGSADQINTVNDFIDRFGNGALKFVDPVMGDDGRLYSTYTNELMLGMSSLCKKADVITPNYTEACFLTDTDYRDTCSLSKPEAEALGRSLCEKLKSKFGADTVLTGINYENDFIMTCGIDQKSGFFSHSVHRIGRNYPGTGDVFASVLLCKLLKGYELSSASELAADFTVRAVVYSETLGEPIRNGVAFEGILNTLNQ